MPKVSVVVVHYKGIQVTQDCLNSLMKLNHNDFDLEVIVVNNNPNENINRLIEKFSEYIFLNTGRNLGFCEGNNYGIKEALEIGSDYILILNNDTRVHPDLISNLLNVFRQEKNVGIVSPKIYFAPGFEYHQDLYQKKDLGNVVWYAGGTFDWNNVLGSHVGVNEIDNKQFEKTIDTDFATGCAMLVSRLVFDQIGLFDSKLFMYLEDIDFCQRAKKQGFRIIYSSKGIVWHKNAISGGEGRKLQDYFMSRNRLIIGVKYANLRAKFALIREAIHLLFIGRQWQKVGIKDYFLNIRGIGSWKG